MCLSQENANLDENLESTEAQPESMDFDMLEEQLQEQLDESYADLAFLEEEKEKIGNPDNLGNVVMDVVWEQFLNQVGINSGEEFIESNNGLTLDLRKDAHIQTTENFANGKIATHNTEIDYQARHDAWQSKLQKDENGNVIMHQGSRDSTPKASLKKDARAPFDKDRPKGSKTVAMDHDIPAAEIIRDPGANAHLTLEEQVKFANSDKNLHPLDAEANESKSDLAMKEWLDSKRDGKTPDERFDINKDQLLKQDKEAREAYDGVKKEGEQRSIEAGKKSQTAEAFRFGGAALKTAVVTMLAALVREIIGKLVIWFKKKAKGLDSLIGSVKEAIHSFVGNLKQNLINAGSAVLTTIATAIIGPVVGVITKVWMMLKHGWKSLREAVDYIKNPENKGKPVGRLIMEVGKIVIAGLTAVGAIALGEVIEKGLMTIPIFLVEIPLFGSLASILGIFFGAVVAGIIGAIAINLIERKIDSDLKRENAQAKFNKGNEVLVAQQKMSIVRDVKLKETKAAVATRMVKRHTELDNAIAECNKAVAKNKDIDDSVQENLDSMSEMLKQLEE